MSDLLKARELDEAVAKGLGYQETVDYHENPIWLNPQEEFIGERCPLHDSPEIQAAVLKDCEERGWVVAVAPIKDSPHCLATVATAHKYAPTYAEALARAWLAAKGEG